MDLGFKIEIKIIKQNIILYKFIPKIFIKDMLKNLVKEQGICDIIKDYKNDMDKIICKGCYDGNGLHKVNTVIKGDNNDYYCIDCVKNFNHTYFCIDCYHKKNIVNKDCQNCKVVYIDDDDYIENIDYKNYDENITEIYNSRFEELMEEINCNNNINDNIDNINNNFLGE